MSKVLKRMKNLREELIVITRLLVMYPSSSKVAKTPMRVVKRTTTLRTPQDRILERSQSLRMESLCQSTMCT